MNTYDEMVAIIQAAKENKTIQYYCQITKKWTFCPPKDPNRFQFASLKFRIAPDYKMKYANIYEHMSTAYLYTNKEQAEAAANKRTACIKISYYDGQNDD